MSYEDNDSNNLHLFFSTDQGYFKKFNENKYKETFTYLIKPN